MSSLTVISFFAVVSSSVVTLTPSSKSEVFLPSSISELILSSWTLLSSTIIFASSSSVTSTTGVLSLVATYVVEISCSLGQAPLSTTFFGSSVVSSDFSSLFFNFFNF